MLLFCHFSSRKRNELSRKVQTKMFVNLIFDANVDQLIQGPLKIWTEHSIFPMTWCGLDFYYDHWRLYPGDYGWLQKTRKVIFNSNNHVGEKRSILMQFSWWINNLNISCLFLNHAMSDVQKLSGKCSVHISKCPCLVRHKINEIYSNFYEVS